MNNTEELIKAALAKQVQRAPHPGPILNALSQPRRRRTRPALVAIIGACVIAGAVVVPLSFRSDQSAPPPPATQAPAPSSSSAVKPVATGIPLKYRPADIPDGFVQLIRGSYLDGTYQRWGWYKDGSLITMHVWTRGNEQFAGCATHLNANQPGVQKITVNGSSGSLRLGPDSGATVRWCRDNDTVFTLTVSSVANPAEVAQKMAASVRPDSSSTVTPTLAFGQLPASITHTEVTVSGKSAEAATADVTAYGNNNNPAISARVVRKGGTLTQEHDGVVVVTVPLPDGRQVEASSQGNTVLSRKQLTEIANGIKVEPNPDFSWVGTR
jgi:hypothetical protein